MDRARHADIRLLALEGVVERDFHVVAKIRPVAARGLATAPPADEIAEHLVENIGETVRETGVETGAARAAGAALLEGLMAEAIIGRALLLVLEDVVRFADVLEFLFGLLIARIAIRVIFHRQLAIGLLDIVRSRLPVDVEKLVIVFLGHRSGLA